MRRAVNALPSGCQGSSPCVTTRYCPMCNRLRPICVSSDDMFIIITCDACGHVHSIKDMDRVKIKPL